MKNVKVHWDLHPVSNQTGFVPFYIFDRKTRGTITTVLKRREHQMAMLVSSDARYRVTSGGLRLKG